jgi:hypothetical protein
MSRGTCGLSTSLSRYVSMCVCILCVCIHIYVSVCVFILYTYIRKYVCVYSHILMRIRWYACRRVMRCIVMIVGLFYLILGLF